ncbi:hypothetical protein [Streptomyces smaragdinus]|uniref:hypothetical protein n=1 Tax=Streptomyces smaragdinus TaxID=2585196 RepID=UPI001295307C|nr:hypothetical protein [Streptomyces smaragdinus]
MDFVQISAPARGNGEVEILRDGDVPGNGENSPPGQEFGDAAVQGGGTGAGADDLNAFVAVEDGQQIQQPGGGGDVVYDAEHLALRQHGRPAPGVGSEGQGQPAVIAHASPPFVPRATGSP